jgi:hypothetical protein
MLTPDEQALKCAAAPSIFTPVDNAWGRNGATTAHLSAMTMADLEAALVMAWEHAVAVKPRSRR